MFLAKTLLGSDLCTDFVGSMQQYSHMHNLYFRVSFQPLTTLMIMGMKTTQIRDKYLQYM